MKRRLIDQTLAERRKSIMRKMQPHLARVGGIASLWSQIELNIDVIIWRLVQGEQQLCACLTSQIQSSSGKMRALKALLELLDKRPDPNPLKTALNKLHSDMEAVQIKRNRAVHDAWHIGHKTRRVYQVRAAVKGRELLFGYSDKVPVRELDRTLAQIRKLLTRLYELEQCIIDELGPSLKTPLPGRFSRIGTNRTQPPRRRSGTKKRPTQPKASPP
jgi:hypothetical protein